MGYVMVIASNRTVATGAGKARVDHLVKTLPRRAWQRHSAGTGTKGQRWYSWVLLDIAGEGRGHHHLLVRRNDRTGELAFYRCYSPGPVTLAAYIRVAGRRWKVEESFQTGKGLTGLDEHQLRRWTSWRRWIILSMLAHAFLAVSASLDRRRATPSKDLIPLTVNEFRRLFTALALDPIPGVAHVVAWSRWRRAHQAAARLSHHRKQAQADLRL